MTFFIKTQSHMVDSLRSLDSKLDRKLTLNLDYATKGILFALIPK